MELRHLRYFIAVAETENVSRAAIQVRVSQPALSRQVRDLEEELGFALLERGARSVRLTAAGRAFLPEARAVLDRVEQAVRTARAAAAGARAELHIGYAPTLTARVLPAALRAHQAESPGVRVRLHDLSTEEMVAGLCEGRLHLAFSVRPAKSRLRGLSFHPLFTDPLRLAVAPGHPFARRRTVAVADAAKHALMAYSRRDYPDYHELLESTFGTYRVAEEHDGVSSLISAVASGAGIALVPSSLACVSGPRLKLVPLRPDPAPISVGALLPRAPVDAAAGAFLVQMRQAADTAGSAGRDA